MKLQNTTKRVKRVKHTAHAVLSVLLIPVFCFSSLGMTWEPGETESPQLQVMSLASGEMTLTDVTAGNLQTMIEADLVANAGQTAGSYDYTVITSLIISGTVNANDTNFIKHNLKNLAVLDMGGVTTTTFINYAFYNCTSLVSVTLPVGCTVSQNMFYNCTSLTIVNNLEQAAAFAGAAFMNCYSLTSVTLPVGCAVSRNMFYNCTSLTIVNNMEQVASFGITAFGGCSSLESVTLPVGCDVSDYLFSRCASLTTVVNMEQAASFGKFAFYHCASLVSVTLPAGCAVADNMFSRCTSLTTVNNLDNAVAIGKHAFYSCVSLRSITISAVFSDNGEKLFFYCRDLEITLLSDSVVAVNDRDTYENATNIIVYVPNTLLAAYQADSNWQYWTTEIGNVTLAGINTRATISAHPADQSVTAGQTAAFYVTASDTTLSYSYQWQVDTGDGFTDISGAVVDEYITTATTIAMSGYQYRCMVTDADGITVTSNAAVLTVNPIAVTGVTLNKQSLSFTVGSTETLTAAIAPLNATNQELDWLVDDSDLVSINNGTVTAIAPGTTNIMAVTEDGGHIAICAVTVNDLPSVSAHPAEQSVIVAQTANFSVTVNAGTLPYSYQWQVDTGSGFADISGAVSDRYAAAAMLDMSGYQYRCIVTDASQVTVTSNAAALTVTMPEVVPPQDIAYSFTMNFGSYTGQADGLTGIIAAEESKFQGMEVNGLKLDNNNYAVKSGSTIITFYPSYLDMLDNGSYAVRVLFDDGYADGSFTVSLQNNVIPATGIGNDKAIANKPATATAVIAPEVTTASEPAQTGDDSRVALWVTTAVSSSIMLLCLIKRVTNSVRRPKK